MNGFKEKARKTVSLALAVALMSSFTAISAITVSAVDVLPNDFSKADLEGHTMGVVGSFNWWDDDIVSMSDDDGDGIYAGVIEDVAAGSYDFKIRLDGAWDYCWGVYEDDYDRTFNSQTNCSITLNSTSELVVLLDTNGADANTWSVAYFALPDEGGDKSGYFAAEDHTYGAIGDFNVWDGDTPMTELAHGVYCANIGDIAAGQSFKIRADGEWNYSWGVYEPAEDRTQNSQTNCTLSENGKNVHIILNTNGSDFETWQVAYFYTAPDGNLKFVDVGPDADMPDEPSIDEPSEEEPSEEEPSEEEPSEDEPSIDEPEPSTDEPPTDLGDNYETQVTDYIYYDNSETKWSTVHAHWWNSDYTKIVDLEGNLWPSEPLDEDGNQDFSNAWPGIEMTHIYGTDIWQARIPFGATRIVFNNGMTDDEAAAIEESAVQAIADGDKSIEAFLEAGVSMLTADLDFNSIDNAGQVYKINLDTEPTTARGHWKNRKFTFADGAWNTYDGYYISETLNTESEKIDFDFSINPNGSIAILGYKGVDTDIVIPDKIKGLPVESIGDYAFYDCDVTSITIPETVNYIGNFAFYDCDGLTSIKIPDDVTYIGESAFDSCRSLETVTGLGKITDINDYTFSYCSNLTDIEIPDSVTTIGSQAFYGCQELKSINISSNVKKIENKAFGDCGALTNINVDSKNENYSSENGVLFDKNKSVLIQFPCGKTGEYAVPDSVTDIADYAFSECYDLTGITMNDNVKNIGNYAFSDCTDLTNIAISKNVTNINNSVFYNCYDLLEITLPDGITSIGEDAFKNCYQLEDITIPDKVTNIGSYAFSSCDNLKSVNIPNGVTSIADGTFSYCYNLTSVTISNNVTEIDDYAFEECEALEKITIPKSVIKIGDSVFEGCSALAEITIPENVAEIGEYTFYYCSNLKKINVDSNNNNFSSADGVLFNKDKSSLVRYPEGKEASYTIPESVTQIENNAFVNSDKLASVIISKGVNSIGDSAFENCDGLTTINIPDNVTLIGQYAFSGCGSLESVKIGKGITNISSGLFDNCENLVSVDLTDNITDIYSYAFAGCYNLTDITIPKNVNGIYYYAFSNCSKLTEIIIPESVTYIGGLAFLHCTGLTDVTIPSSVTDMENDVFRECYALTDINVDGNNEYYSSENGVLFNKDKSLLIFYPEGKKGAYTIPDSVIYISDYSFKKCEQLTSVTIPNGVKTINDYAFDGCIALTGVNIPESVEYIGDYAFDNCIALTSVNIPESVEYIGYNAFGFYFDDYEWESMNTDLIIYGKVGSAAEEYAEKYNVPFVDVDNPVIPVVRVTLDKTEIEIEEGKTAALTATVLPDNAVDKTVIWTTDNENVATVKDGVVTAVGQGWAHITATTVNGKRAVCDVMVIEPIIEATGIKLNKTDITMEKGDFTDLIPTITPDNATYTSVTWTTDDENVADVEYGTVYAIGAGTTTIRAITDNGLEASCKVTVVISPERIELNKTSVTIEKGKTEKLTATITPDDATDKTVTWTTDNDKVAVVSNGTVSAVGVGTAVITASTANGIKKTCTVTVKEPTVEVTSVKLSKTSVNIQKGKSTTITATITPSNATNKTVTWTSSNTKVATVSGGKITAKSAGTATITAKTANGKKATCKVTVTNPDVAVTGIKLSKTSVNIQKGKSTTITATITPSNATNKTVTWTSSNTKVATVSGGKITAKSAGTATITAKTANGKKATCKVTVTNSTVAVTGIKLSKTSVSLTKGKTTTITATITPSNATNKTVTWTSSNTKVATVSGGKITAKSAGTATITAKTANGKKATCKVTVTNSTVAVKGIKLSKTSVNIQKGKSTTITATITPSNATNKTVTWTSSNTKVATVSGGKITAKSAGTATITAKTANGKKATCKVTVKNPVVNASSIKLNKSNITLEKGKTTTLSAVINPKNTTNKNIKWTSTNTKVATVSKGKITAKSVGMTIIMAETSNGRKATCKVTVKNAKTVNPTSVKLSKTSVSLVKGKSTTLKATVYPSNASNKKVTWTSSNKKVATVSNGKITAKGVGTATITVKTANNKKATCKVTVKNAKTVNPTSVKLSKSSVTLGKGKSTTLKATVNPSNASNKKVTWTSSNKKVATVSNGKITAKGVGTATITVKTANNKKATCRVTVKNLPTSVKLSKTTVTLKKGKTLTLKATVNPTKNVINTVTWSTGNSKVATVKNGKITAKSIGTAVITVKTSNGKTAKCTVKVTK